VKSFIECKLSHIIQILGRLQQILATASQLPVDEQLDAKACPYSVKVIIIIRIIQ